MLLKNRSWLVLSLFFSLNLVQAKEISTQEERLYLKSLSQSRAKYFPRQYRTFKLPNGLEVLLIQDVREKMASASLDVKAGLYLDPVKYPGLAHYLEHMLFLGTKKYPQPNEYMEFISKNNGYTNAYTDREHTNYQFQVAPTAFLPSLDRFAQFFIHPKFDETYISKEIENIESEYKKNLDNNSYRSYHLLNILANPSHPQSKVFQGNKETLQSIPRQVLIDYFKKNYSANRMKLTVISPLGISKIESTLKKLFSAIPSSSKKAADILEQPIYQNEAIPRVVEMKSVGDQDSVSLLFSVPSSREYSYSKPFHYLNSFLTRSGTGSFRRTLEEKGWITDIYAGMLTETQNEAIYLVSFSIPKDKRDHWKEICSIFFSYVHFLQKEGLKKSYFIEHQKKAELSFIYGSPHGGIGEASHLAHQMHYYSPLSIEAETRSLVRYSESAFLKALNSLTPDRTQILRIRPDLEDGLHEKKYDIKYKISKLDEKLIHDWKAVPIDTAFSYPDSNPYLPQNLKLLGQPQELPQLIQNSNKQKLWIKVDHTFELPKAVLSYEILTETPNTPEYAALIHLYQKAVEKSHPQWKTLTSEAGLGVNFGATGTGFSVSFYGYSDRISNFATDFLEKLSTVDISEKEFEAIKNDEIRTLENEKFADAYRVAFHRVSLFNDPYSFLSSEILPHLKDISLKDVRKLAQNPFKKIFVRGYGFGSVTADTVEKVSEKIYTSFNAEPMNSHKPKYERIHFPEGKAFHYWDDVHGKNNAWFLFYQFGKTTPELEMAIQVGHNILSTPFYNEMRTQRGFGYIAQAMSYSDALTSNLGFMIQSDRPLEEVTPIAETWIQQAVTQMHQTSPQDFNQIKATLLETLKKKPSTFEEKSWEISSALFHYYGDLKWKEKRIQALENLTINQVVEVFKKALDSKNQSKISIFVLGKEGQNKKFSRPDEKEVTNLNQFKRNLDRYSLDI